MKKVVKSWRFSTAGPVTKFKTMRLFAGETLVQKKGIYFITLLLVAASLALSCDDDDEVHCGTRKWKGFVLRLHPTILLNMQDMMVMTLKLLDIAHTWGIHYLNASLLDDKFEVEKPELLLYAPDENNKLKFVAVEYAVPIEDLNNPPPVPEGFKGADDVWEINTEFKLWTLHVWVKLENPDGIFAPHNPALH